LIFVEREYVLLLPIASCSTI